MRDAGFTLMEALAGLAVTGAVLLGLGEVSAQWLPQWRHGFAALQSADLVGLALDRIVEDISSAEYARMDGGQGAPLFRGEAEAVAFVRQAIGPNAGAGLEAVRIGEMQTQQGAEVQRARTSFTPGGVGAFSDPVTLLRPPLRISFAYAGADGRWRSSWLGEPKLPRLTRVEVRSGEGRIVASTAFALKVTSAPEISAGALAPGDNARGKAGTQ